MCKIMALTNASKIKDLEKVINIVRPIITDKDKDGFGWALTGSEGVFGERSTNVNARSRLNVKHPIDLPIVKKSFESFGTVGAPTQSMIMHARVSTNNKGLVNTHPLRKHGWTLVHNGVVTNRGPEYQTITTNDTEHVLEYIAKHGIESLTKNLTGYYAFATIDDKNLLHICRDKIATLHISFIDDLESYIFATTPDLIEEFCKKLQCTYSSIDELEEDIYLIFQGNEMVHYETIKSLGKTNYEAPYMSRSVSYLDDYKTATDYNKSWTQNEGGLYSQKKTQESDTAATSNESGVIGSQITDIIDRNSKNGDAALLARYPKFFAEIEKIGGGYEIYDPADGLLPLWGFKALSKKDQLDCTIVRPNGSIILPDAEKTNQSA